MIRTVRSLRVLRHLLAVAIALAFSANVLEAVIPDVHDGDAIAATLAHQDGGDSSGDQHQIPHESSHGAHVEHCGHAHLASLTSGPLMDMPGAAPSSAPAFHTATLESVAMPPAFRPPIALS
jgi:hypothetical protein